MQKLWFGCAALTALAAGSLSAQTPPRVQTFPLRDTTGLIAFTVKTARMRVEGRSDGAWMAQRKK